MPCRSCERLAIDLVAAHELVLWCNNDYETYQHLEAVQRNMTRKMAAGTYDSEMAVRAFMPVTEVGAKSYVKGAEQSMSWHELFPVPVRREAAKELRDEFEAEVDLNPQDFEQHVYKKHVPSWKERYRKESSTRLSSLRKELRNATSELTRLRRRAFRGGPNQERVMAAIKDIYDTLDMVFNGDAVNEWEEAYEHLNALDKIARDYGYQLDR